MAKYDKSRAWKEARTLLHEHRGPLGIGLALMVVNRFAGLVLPWTSKFLIDDVIGKHRADRLMPLAAAARQMYAMEQGRQTGDEDYSAVIRLMGHLAHESRRDPTDGGTSPQVNWDALAQGRAS